MQVTQEISSTLGVAVNNVYNLINTKSRSLSGLDLTPDVGQNFSVARMLQISEWQEALQDEPYLRIRMSMRRQFM